MKKVLSILVAAIMTVSVFTLSVVPAFAADVYSPTATTAANKGPSTQVNGVNNTTDITYTPDSKDSNTITFVYTGEGTLTGWDENLAALGFVEGEDYTITNNSDGSLTITFLSADAIASYENGEVIVNALVDFDTATTTASASTNDSSKSPATGLSSAVVAGSVAVACAGVAVLAATKKRDAE